MVPIRQNPKALAMQMISNNPNIANDPNAKEIINVIQSGDNKRGVEIATNICNTYGITPQQAMLQAKNFFNI